MKWGKKKLYSKSSSTSSSRPSFISHVFPISWISKFKQKSRDVETKQVKVKHDEGKWNSAFMSSQTCDSGRGGEKFYGGEGDGFWRLSFGDEGIEGKSSKSVPSSAWYNSQDDFGFQPSTCKSCGSNATTVMGQEEIQMFDNLNLDTRKIRGLSRNLEILPELGEVHEALKKTSKVTTDKEKKLKKINPRVPEEEWSKLKMYSIVAEEKSKKSIEKDNLEFGRLRNVQVMQGENCRKSAEFQKFHFASSSMSKNCNSKETEEDGVFAARSLNEISAAKTSSEWEVLKQMKINELKSKSENQRKSLYVSRELQRKRTKHSSKVKVSSPRLKALEDMKKAKLKMKKGKEKTLDGRTGLESFAVVTTSFDPQKDFRDSMNEMIIEKKISQPEELEELLACYLTLNSDEYHDLIIKVFRQVWFDMNRANFDNELQNEKYFS